MMERDKYIYFHFPFSVSFQISHNIFHVTHNFSIDLVNTAEREITILA